MTGLLDKLYLVLIFVGLGLAYLAYRRFFSGGPRPLKGSDPHTPFLDLYCADFTGRAKLGDLDTVVGREDEIRRVIQVLSRRSKNNAILIGPPGVGKTAIVEGLAQRIAAGQVPEALKNKRLLALDVATLMSGTKYRGEFEERAKKIVGEIERTRRSIILFIDEVHSVVQSQGSEGSLNLSDILKPALSRGDLQMIGATTFDEYNKYIKTDSAFERRFQPVDVAEPSPEQTVVMLRGVLDMYRDYHHVEYTETALTAAVRRTAELVPDRRLPDKAIDAIDEAAAMVKVSHLSAGTEPQLLSVVAASKPQVVELWQAIMEADRLAWEGSDEAARRRATLENELRDLGVLVVDSGDIEAVVQGWLK